MEWQQGAHSLERTALVQARFGRSWVLCGGPGIAQQEGSQQDGFLETGYMDWHRHSPFDFSQIILSGGCLFVPSSLPGPPVLR